MTFLDAAGLQVLVGGLEHAWLRGGCLQLVITSERILRVFTITKLAHLFPIYTSVDEAMVKASADRHGGPLHGRGRG